MNKENAPDKDGSSKRPPAPLPAPDGAKTWKIHSTPVPPEAETVWVEGEESTDTTVVSDASFAKVNELLPDLTEGQKDQIISALSSQSSNEEPDIPTVVGVEDVFDEDTAMRDKAMRILKDFNDADNALSEEDFRKALELGTQSAADGMDFISDTALDIIPGLRTYLEIQWVDPNRCEKIVAFEKKVESIADTIREMAEYVEKMDQDGDGYVTLTDANVWAIKAGTSILIQQLSDLADDPKAGKEARIAIQLIQKEAEKQLKRLKIDKKKKIKIKYLQKALIAAKEASQLNHHFKRPVKSWKRLVQVVGGILGLLAVIGSLYDNLTTPESKTNDLIDEVWEKIDELEKELEKYKEAEKSEANMGNAEPAHTAHTDNIHSNLPDGVRRVTVQEIKSTLNDQIKDQ